MLSTILFLALFCINYAQSFTLHTSLSLERLQSISAVPKVARNILPVRKMSSSDGETGAPRKRRRRKDAKNTQSTENTALTEEEDIVEEPVVEIPKSNPVQMQVADIRDVVAGKTSTPEKTTTPVVAEEEEEDELEDDEEYEYYYEDENNNEVIVGTSATKDNSLEALLADARKMRESETKKAADGEEEKTMKQQIRGILSTIVTADFFFVCALLAWFLAGIFCSYIIKDDTVQIAFNGIFEPIVQPALGILMIGSAAGGALDESEE